MYAHNTQLVDNQTYTYTYLIADAQTRDAVIIDPVYEKVERDVELIKQLKLNLKYASKQRILLYSFLRKLNFFNRKKSTLMFTLTM